MYFKEEKNYHREDIYASRHILLKIFLKSGLIDKKKHGISTFRVFFKKTCFNAQALFYKI